MNWKKLKDESPDPPRQIPLDTLLDIKASDIKHLVCFSGGKDSVALVLDLLERGVDKNQIVLHHHEVDGHGEELFDWKVTTQYCRAFAKALDLEILFSYREGGIVREMFRQNEGLQDVLYQQKTDGPFHRLVSRKGSSTRMKFPAVKADLRTRWCSSAVKIDILSRVATNHPDYQEGRFIIYTGERREESVNRSKYDEWEFYRADSPKKGRHCIQWRSILDWTEQEVWDIMKRWRIQPHPCYELGWSRCSCQTCIFGSANVWASIQQISPEKIDRIEQIEFKLEHTLYNAMPIRIKAKMGKSFVDSPQEMIDQAIKEFTMPVFLPETQEWKLPKGAFGGEVSGAT